METDLVTKKKKPNKWVVFAVAVATAVVATVAFNKCWDTLAGGPTAKLERAGIKLTEAEVKGDPGAAYLCGLCFLGDMERVRLLVDAGAPVNANLLSSTPLSQACSSGRVDIVRYLLTQGADPNLKVVIDYKGLPPDTQWQLASAGVQEGDYFYPLHISARMWSVEVVKALLDAGADANLTSNSGLLPLTYAILGPEAAMDFVRHAVSDSAHVQQAIAKVDARTQADQMEIVRLLLARTSNVDQADKDGVTSLMCAAASGNSELVKLLLEAGAKTDLKDCEGGTALDYASTQECIDLLKPATEEGQGTNADSQ